MDYLKAATDAIEARANVFEVMAHIDSAMREHGASEDDVIAYLETVLQSGDYETALAISRRECRRIAG